jgi:CBS domain-containing protein
VLLLVVKATIWSAALGSGTSGGVLAPLLIIGGAMGAALGVVLPDASPGFWALLAMAATMGGTMRSPLTATFFATELTGNTHILLPVVSACVTAHLVTVLLMRRSILTEKVARRGHHLVREYRVDPFTLTRVEEVMTTEVETLPETMTLQAVTAFLNAPDTRHPSFPALDAGHRVLGIVNLPTVQRWHQAGWPLNATLRELFTGHKILLAHPDEYLASIVDRMMEANIDKLSVVSRSDYRLIGYVGWKDLLRIRTKLQTEETRRSVFYRWPSYLRPANGKPRSNR